MFGFAAMSALDAFARVRLRGRDEGVAAIRALGAPGEDDLHDEHDLVGNAKDDARAG